VYSYAGAHLGWFEAGWVIDHAGKYVFWTPIASNAGPDGRILQTLVEKKPKQARPSMGSRQAEPEKPASKVKAWSTLSGKHWFEQ
jgi:hypothetical protein